MSLFDSNILLQVKSTVEQEREEFMRHKEMFRTDQDPARRIVHQKRKYSVSQASVDSVTDTQMILRHKTATIYIKFGQHPVLSEPRGVEICREADSTS